MRLGNTAAASFLGTQFASLYLGAVRVPTVPGKPVITSAVAGVTTTQVDWDAPESDGGSAITAYRLYVGGDADDGAQIDLFGAVTVEGGEDAIVQVAAINAIGEGPLSDPVTVT